MSTLPKIVRRIPCDFFLHYTTDASLLAIRGMLQKSHLDISDDVKSIVKRCRLPFGRAAEFSVGPRKDQIEPYNLQRNFIKQKKVALSNNLFVGVLRLERRTPCSQSRCASQLRHTPIFVLDCKDINIF